MPNTYDHFKDKDAIGHVAEAQAQGIISAAEIHGMETPGYISAFADAARDTSILLFLILPFLLHFNISIQAIPYLSFGLIGLTAWRFGRASLFGWGRLERLHRVLEQEKWEIDHNRPQERDELRELYRAKGFDGKMLEDVLDVLMADQDRLLRVMVEEEMGLSLQNVEHPLKQGIGAGSGVIITAILSLLALNYGSLLGLGLIALLIIGLTSCLLANFAQNKLLSAIIWNLSLSLFAFGLTYYTLKIYS